MKGTTVDPRRGRGLSVVWFSCYLSSCPEDGLNLYIFLLAILIAQRVWFALASLYLGSLYAQLDECIGNIVQVVERYDVVMHANAYFLKMFLSKRFALITSKPPMSFLGSFGGGDTVRWLQRN